MTRRSLAQANSAPRPSAEPLRAATKMTPLRFIFRKVWCSRSSWTAGHSGVLPSSGLQPAGAVDALRGAGERGGALDADRRNRRSALLQPADLGVADEALRMGAGEDDRVDVRVAVGPVDERVELLGDVVAEQPERAAVDPGDQHGSAVLDLEVSSDFFCHDRPSFLQSPARLAAGSCGNGPRRCRASRCTRSGGLAGRHRRDGCSPSGSASWPSHDRPACRQSPARGRKSSTS